MAKGNLLLGTAGNSVGDVVMYRREGAQVSRVRVRKVKNPKTAAQSTQRAFFAPVAKFYSPLSIVLERSYEGLSKSKSYSKFLKTNVDLARQNGWLLPKGTGFFPLPYKLSHGSIPVINGIWNSGDSSLKLENIPMDNPPSSIGAISAGFIAAGYKEGDVVTLIAISGDNQLTNLNFVPFSAQFVVDSNSVVDPSAVLGNLSLAVNSNTLSIKLKTGSCVAAAVIVARYQNDVWRRSTQNLVVDPAIITAIAATNFKAAAIASYGATNTGDNPLVYLDGEELV